MNRDNGVNRATKWISRSNLDNSTIILSSNPCCSAMLVVCCSHEGARVIVLLQRKFGPFCDQKSISVAITSFCVKASDKFNRVKLCIHSLIYCKK